MSTAESLLHFEKSARNNTIMYATVSGLVIQDAGLKRADHRAMPLKNLDLTFAASKRDLLNVLSFKEFTFRGKNREFQ